MMRTIMIAIGVCAAAFVTASAVLADTVTVKKKVAVPVSLVAAASSGCSATCTITLTDTRSASASGAGASCGKLPNIPNQGAVFGEVGTSATICNCTNNRLQNVTTPGGNLFASVPPRGCITQ